MQGRIRVGGFPAFGALTVPGAAAGLGLLLSRPVQVQIGHTPPELGAEAETLLFASASGATLHGWLVPGQIGDGAVVLMHGVRANRLAMLDRALVLHQNGFAVLLFDFQVHGESTGRHITAGYLEWQDLHRGGKSAVQQGAGAESLLGRPERRPSRLERYDPAVYWQQTLPFLTTNLQTHP